MERCLKAFGANSKALGLSQIETVLIDCAGGCRKRRLLGRMASKQRYTLTPWEGGSLNPPRTLERLRTASSIVLELWIFLNYSTSAQNEPSPIFNIAEPGAELTVVTL
jgi:hypothetical protein